MNRRSSTATVPYGVPPDWIFKLLKDLKRLEILKRFDEKLAFDYLPPPLFGRRLRKFLP